MASEGQKLNSIFPDLPREIPAVDDKGNFSPLWSLGFSSLFQALQRNFKNEGILFPSLSATNLDNIQAIYTPLIGNPLPINVPDISGQTVFDKTNRIPKQFIITYDTSTPPNILSASWLMINVMTFSAGNPNGAVAGVLNWFCYDFTDKILYICTTSGSTSSAVWTSL
jgi:hypothetical protein